MNQPDRRSVWRERLAFVLSGRRYLLWPLVILILLVAVLALLGTLTPQSPFLYRL